MSDAEKNKGPYEGGSMDDHEAKEAHQDYSGFTGGTGASGLGGAVGQAISSILDMNESVETFAQKVAYAGLYGATGGEGELGSIENNIKSGVSLADMSKKFSKKISLMNDPDAILKDFTECQTTLELVEYKTNAVKAYYALMQGKRLLKLQALRAEKNSRNWIEWISNKLPNLKKRTREKDMSLASFPGVESHLADGVERLAEFGTHYSFLSDEQKMLLGDDPYKTYMEKFKVPMDSSYEEHRHMIDAVLEVSKLNRMKVDCSLEVMLKFLRIEDPLKGDERKHLKKLAETDPSAPAALLEKIIKKDLKRVNFIAGTDAVAEATETPDTNGNKDGEGDAGKSAQQATSIPNIDRLVASLCKSLKPVATKEIQIEGAIDRDSLLELRNYIDQLLALEKEALSSATPDVAA
jgi:hypothetical protein